MAASQRNDVFATRVYVVGEVLVSLLALAGGFAMVFFSTDEAAKLVGSGAASAVISLWFSRRSNENSTTHLRSLANDELAELRSQQTAQRESLEAMVTVLAQRQR